MKKLTIKDYELIRELIQKEIDGRKENILELIDLKIKVTLKEYEDYQEAKEEEKIPKEIIIDMLKRNNIKERITGIEEG